MDVDRVVATVQRDGGTVTLGTTDGKETVGESTTFVVEWTGEWDVQRLMVQFGVPYRTTDGFETEWLAATPVVETETIQPAVAETRTVSVPVPTGLPASLGAVESVIETRLVTPGGTTTRRAPFDVDHPAVAAVVETLLTTGFVPVGFDCVAADGAPFVQRVVVAEDASGEDPIASVVCRPETDAVRLDVRGESASPPVPVPETACGSPEAAATRTEALLADL